MMNRPQLPAPSADAAALSRTLQSRLLDEAGAAGFLPFSRYMELALYAPGLGYYSAGAAKLGPDGDFTTAPELTPLFGRTLARQVDEILAQTGGGVLEVGAGSGKLARDLLLEMEALGRLPEEYLILELSADLRQRQKDCLVAGAAHLLSRVRWLDALPGAFTGVVLGNEVLDAMPVDLVAWRPDGIFERGLEARDGRLAWAERPAAGALLEAARRVAPRLSPPPSGYVSEINRPASAFIASLARVLSRGAVIMIDYGFGAGEYYHPERTSGTLMCHYRHFAHDDPLYWPGLQDITAHVDFSAVYQAGVETGLRLHGYTTQAHFLLNAGLGAVMERTPPDGADWYRLAAAAQKLTSPAEMGELFKVIALGRGLDGGLSGFARGDLSRLL